MSKGTMMMSLCQRQCDGACSMRATGLQFEVRLAKLQ